MFLFLPRSVCAGLLVCLDALALAAAALGEAPDPFVELEGALDFVHDNGGSGQFYLPEITCAAGALFDFDNDGDLDIYLAQGQRLETDPYPRLRDRLLRNDLASLADGRRRPRFVDVTESSGIVATGYGCGVATGDYDNDGWTDLYLTHLGANQMWRNNGDGTFSDTTAPTGTDDQRWSVPATFFDFDGDGWLDLYVGNYLDFTLAGHKVCRTAAGAHDYCNPSSYSGVPDRLLRNRGDGTFEDLSGRTGIERQRSKSLGVAVADFDSDGRPDLYVTNDGVANQLWLQKAPGRFTDEALLAGTAVNGRGKAEASMGVAAADFDGDGDVDLFLTHLSGETNTLYHNDGRGAFTDRTVAAGLGAPSWGSTSWGVVAVDFDNDGWLDLPVVSGAVRTLEQLANAGDPFPFHQPNQLFRNRGDGSFTEVSPGAALARSEVSRGLAVGDLDNDGDSDLLVINNRGPARLLLNQTGQDRAWLGLRLVGDDGRGRDMLGARVELRRPERPSLWRTVTSGGSYGAANDPRLLFGLGDSAPPVTVRVYWPSGRIEEWNRLTAGRYVTLREGSGRSAR